MIIREHAPLSFAPNRSHAPNDSVGLLSFPRRSITYANPISLAAEQDRIYVFGRWAGFKPNIMWSDDEGLSFSKSKVLITNYPSCADKVCKTLMANSACLIGTNKWSW